MSSFSTRPDLFNVGLLMVTLLLIVLPQLSQAQCVRGSINVCCSGKNSTCFSYERFQQATGEPGRIRRCYCDASCTRTRDCCQDYYLRCKRLPKDCAVAPWNGWSPCSHTCGAGQRSRSRAVLWKEENGGRPCPALRESKFCQLRPCPVVVNVNRVLRETAQLLPAKGNVFRVLDQFNMKFDIRRNLYYRTLAKQNKTENNLPPYCVEYEMETTNCKTSNRFWSSAFQFLTWVKHVTNLAPKNHICVTCLPNYMKSGTGNRCSGTGAMNQISRWSAAKLPNCHGTFKMVTAPRICTCPSNGQWSQRSFLFI